MTLQARGRLHFSIDIRAPRATIWKVLWDDATFRDWAGLFAEGPALETDWQEGSRFEFYDSTGPGSYGIIARHVPVSLLTFAHQGEIFEGRDRPFADGPRLERYALTEEGAVTTLTLDQDVPDEETARFFQEATPRAFARIKELAEAAGSRTSD